MTITDISCSIYTSILNAVLHIYNSFYQNNIPYALRFVLFLTFKILLLLNWCY